ncbi:MAG: hypothetical protein JEZ07_20210 [Phycisphaerae bacterium]|nr:hypothetical protein [Phycisphaerae bacterium]
MDWKKKAKNTGLWLLKYFNQSPPKYERWATWLWVVLGLVAFNDAGINFWLFMIGFLWGFILFGLAAVHIMTIRMIQLAGKCCTKYEKLQKYYQYLPEPAKIQHKQWMTFPICLVIVSGLIFASYDNKLRVKCSNRALNRFVNANIDELPTDSSDCEQNAGRIGLFYISKAYRLDDCVFLQANSGWFSDEGLVYSGNCQAK